MDKFKEAAKLFRQLADLFDDLEGTATPAAQAAADQPAQLLPSGKWVKYCLQLEAPIGKPKARRIMDRVAPSPMAKRQLEWQMGPGSKGTKTFVVAFIVKVMDRGGDVAESAARHLADKIDARGSDKRARAKVSEVSLVA